jgi:serine/threonine protein kinase
MPDDRSTPAKFDPSANPPVNDQTSADSSVTDQTTAEGQENSSHVDRHEPATGNPLSDTDRLGRNLEAIQLVTSEDFRTVADIHQHDPRRILNDLEAKGVITAFQRSRLAEGKADRLVMDEYVILDRIGIGGMGEVFKARNRALDRIEAIKTMNAGHDPSSSISQRFHREAKMLARIEHPSIVPIYKVGHAQGVDYIAMKFIDGLNLKEKVDQTFAMGQMISLHQAIEWITQAAGALAKAHQESIIHRDIKPGNLMVTPEGRLYLLDLGIARLVQPTPNPAASLTRQASSMGTPEFMPPEQWADATMVTPETDIYALGCTLFFLLTGRAPFVGDKLSDVMRGHTSETPPLVSSLRPDVPREIDPIVAKMLEKEPESRYRQASEVIDALRRVPIEPELMTRARPFERLAPKSSPAKKPMRRRSWAPVLVSVLALAGGIATASWWYAGRPDNKEPKTLAERTKDATQTIDSEKEVGKELPATPVQKQPSIAADKEAMPPLLPPVPAPPITPEPAPEWVARYSMDNALEWGDDLDIIDFAKKETGGQTPDSLSESLKKKLDAETARRRASRVDTLMAELITSLPTEQRGAWPDRAELAEFVGTLKSFDSVSSVADLQAVRPAIEAESNRLAAPFDGVNYDKAGEDWAKQWAKAAAENLRQMMMLHAKPASIQAFEAGFLDEAAHPIDRAKVKVPVTLAYRSARPVHLTVVQWDDQGLTSISLSKESPATNGMKPLSTIRFDLPGSKLLVIYATSKPYFSESVNRVDGDPVKLDEVFSTPRIENRLRKAFANGKPLVGVPPTAESIEWTRSVVRLEVTPQ